MSRCDGMCSFVGIIKFNLIACNIDLLNIRVKITCPAQPAGSHDAGHICMFQEDFSSTRVID